jgi:hypothetical protein
MTMLSCQQQQGSSIPARAPFDAVTLLHGQFTMQQDILDENHGLRDLVEPVQRPRIHELVINPFLDFCEEMQREARANVHGSFFSYRSRDQRRPPVREPYPRYSEWQIVGSCDDGGGDGGEDTESGEGRADSLLDRLVARFTSNPAYNGRDDGVENTIQRLLSFLLHEQPVTRVIWLSRVHFVVCDGPASHVPDPNHMGWWNRVVAFHADVQRVDDGNHYRICLGVAAGGRRISQEGRAERAGDWPPVLAALLARSALLRAIQCDLNVSRHVRFLEAIVSPAPPFPGGRDLTLGLGYWQFDVTEDAARILAYRTHPDTRVQIDLRKWGRDGALILADSVRTNRCPRRLKFRGADQLESAEPLASALRVTRSVEVLEGQFSPGWSPQVQRCTDLLLAAIGDNVGLRTLVAEQSCRKDVCGRMKAMWSSVLRSRTLQCVNVQLTKYPVEPPPADADRREVARHVVDLLRSNRAVTDLRYNPATHDPDIMEAHAIPILQLNRLRAAAGATVNRCLLLFLGSKPVRRHPMLRYHLLRSSVSTLVRHGDKSASSPRGSGENERERKRARIDGPTAP